MQVLGCHLGCHLPFFFLLLQDRETDNFGKLKSIFSVLGWGNCHHFTPSHIIYIVRKSPIYKGFGVSFVCLSPSNCVRVACVGVWWVSVWLPLAASNDFEWHHPTLAMLEV